jgi:L-arabinose transport system substrate-binding protein
MKIRTILCGTALAAAVLVGGIASCAKAKKITTAADVKIGFLVKQPEEQWFQNEWTFAQQCADQYGFKLQKIGVPDGEKLLSAIDNLNAQGAQGFVVCVPDIKLGPAVAKKAAEYSMKVFAVDDQFMGSDGSLMSDVPYMGLSARNIGKQVGSEIWAEMQKRGWKTEDVGACVPTYDVLNTVKERTDGATDTLLALGFKKEMIFASAEKALDIPSAMDAANVILTQNPKIKQWIVYSVNDESVIGAIRALEGRGFAAENVIGIGIGAGQGFNEFKKEKPTGYFACCMISPKRHGFETSELMFKWIMNSQEPPKDTRTAGVMANRENYKQVAKDLGLESLL